MIPFPSRSIPVVLRDCDLAILEILRGDESAPEFMLAAGFRICGRCERWCEPVEVDADVLCGKCLHHHIEVAVIRSRHLLESPAEEATRIYKVVVHTPTPRKVS